MPLIRFSEFKRRQTENAFRRVFRAIQEDIEPSECNSVYLLQEVFMQLINAKGLRVLLLVVVLGFVSSAAFAGASPPVQ